MAGRGAWRQSRHRRLPRFCSDAVSHRLAMRRRFLLLPSPSGRRWRRRRHRTCVHRRARWRASPVGNAKTCSTPSHDDGVEHKWWLPSPPPPPLLPPWASSRRPRHHIRRRLRRATRCVGAFAAAPAQHARALRAIVLRARAGQSLRVRAQLLRSARASRRAAKRAGRSMANVEMVGSSAVRRRAWSRPQRDAEARASRGAQKGSTDARIKGGPSQYPERLLRSPFSGSPGFHASVPNEAILCRDT